MGRLVGRCMEIVPDELKAELKVFLSKMLEEKTAAELLDVLNREERDVGFGSKGAKAFFIAALDQLSRTDQQAKQSRHGAALGS